MIDVKHLSYQYPGASQLAIKDISFAIREGEIFGFLGPSGAGKSTAQKILFKLLTGYSGSARVGGQEVRDCDQALYNKIGVCFELPNHYLKLTARENLAFFRQFYPRTQDPMALLEMVGLAKDADKRVGDFSKGMKMRLNFVRAIMHDPQMLFLDEPTAGLDPGNARVVKDIILDLKAKGKTIFLTTHQMYDADELCDQVAFLVDGEIKAMDSPEHLKLQHSERAVEVQVRGSEHKHVFSLDGLDANAAFHALLREHEVETIHSQEPTLDDIFITVTGKTLIP